MWSINAIHDYITDSFYIHNRQAVYSGDGGARAGGGRQPVVVATCEERRPDVSVSGGVRPGLSTSWTLDRPRGTEVELSLA